MNVLFIHISILTENKLFDLNTEIKSSQKNISQNISSSGY